jgi:hypothetical protein
MELTTADCTPNDAAGAEFAHYGSWRPKVRQTDYAEQLITALAHWLKKEGIFAEEGKTTRHNVKIPYPAKSFRHKIPFAIGLSVGQLRQTARVSRSRASRINGWDKTNA